MLLLEQRAEQHNTNAPPGRICAAAWIIIHCGHCLHLAAKQEQSLAWFSRMHTWTPSIYVVVFILCLSGSLLPSAKLGNLNILEILATGLA